MEVYVWLALLVVFLIVEAATVGLVSLWFAAGALAAMIAALLGGELWLQLVLFCVVSGALLIALRPFARKLLRPGIVPTNVDAVIGTEGVVVTAIDNLSATGEVKLGAVLWSARSTDGTSIPEGTKVRVEKVEGVKVLVSPVCVSVNQ